MTALPPVILLLLLSNSAALLENPSDELQLPPESTTTALLAQELAALRATLSEHSTRADARADAAEAAAAALSERVATLEQQQQQQQQQAALARRRRAQDTEVADPSGDHSFVHLIKRNATVDTSGGASSSSGDRGDTSAPGKCGVAELPARTASINQECCDEPTEDCTDGRPHSCNAGCASIFLPFWRDCRGALGKASAQFEEAVELCSSTGASPPALAQQLSLQCTDGTDAQDCIPTCSPARRGWTLLLNIDGDDAQLSCILSHGLYSWSGAAGGFLGGDVDSFLSAVITGAPGWYFTTLSADHAVETPLTIQPGQSISLAGSAELTPPPSWDAVRTGNWDAFTVSAHGLLSVTRTTVHGMVRVSSGGSLVATASMFGSSVVLNGGTATFIAGATTFQEDLTVSGGSVVLTGCVFNATTAGLSASAYGPSHHASISLVEMALPSHVLSAALSQLRGAGASLALDAVAVTEWTDTPLTGTVTMVSASSSSGAAAAHLVYDPPDLLDVMPAFVVNSGPCTVSDGGRCVGRPEGYLRGERCSISVGGVATITLGKCQVFDTDTDHYDRVAWGSGPSGSAYDGSDCPEGQQLTPGLEVTWQSDSGRQGSVGGPDGGNGCVAKGMCGLPWSLAGIGGGWEICAE